MPDGIIFLEAFIGDNTGFVRMRAGFIRMRGSVGDGYQLP